MKKQAFLMCAWLPSPIPNVNWRSLRKGSCNFVYATFSHKAMSNVPCSSDCCISSTQIHWNLSLKTTLKIKQKQSKKKNAVLGEFYLHDKMKVRNSGLEREVVCLQGFHCAHLKMRELKWHRLTICVPWTRVGTKSVVTPRASLLSRREGTL